MQITLIFFLKNLGLKTFSWFCACIDGIIETNEDGSDATRDHAKIITNACLDNDRMYTALSLLTHALTTIGCILLSHY